MKLYKLILASALISGAAIGCMTVEGEDGPMAAASESLNGTGTVGVANASSNAATGFWWNATKTAGRNGTIICKTPSAYTTYRVGAITATHGGPSPQGAFTVRATSASYPFSANTVVFGTTTFVKMTSASAPAGQLVLPLAATGGTGTAGDLWDSGSESYYPNNVSRSSMSITSNATDCDTGASGTQKWLQTASGTVSRETDDGGDVFIVNGAVQGLKEGEDSGGDGNNVTCMTPFTSTDVSNIDAQCRAWCNAPCGVSDAKVVFVTAASYTGSGVGGQAGANSICQTAATNAGLSGTFKAWISTTTTNAAANVSTHASIPYVRRDGVLVANNWTDLTDGTIQNAIDRDQNGNVIAADANGFKYVWTASNSDGTYNASGDCGAWSSTSGSAVYGNAPSTNTSWSGVGARACNESYHLYCVQN